MMKGVEKPAGASQIAPHAVTQFASVYRQFSRRAYRSEESRWWKNREVNISETEEQTGRAHTHFEARWSFENSDQHKSVSEPGWERPEWKDPVHVFMIEEFESLRAARIKVT